MSRPTYEDFITWEQRTRGWQLWPQCVELEPPFRPFQVITPHTPPPDTSLKAGFWSLLRGKDYSTAAPPPPVQIEEPEATPRTDYDDLFEIQVAFPPDFLVRPDVTREFLTSLQNFRNPISFEIVGLSDRIVVQLACRSDDYNNLKAKLTAFFPEAVFERDELLFSYFGDKRHLDASAFYDFGLKTVFLAPLDVAGSFAVDPFIPLIAVMERLREDEIAVFQVLFQLAHKQWALEALEVVSAMDEAEMLRSANSKLASPLFAVVIRIAVAAENEYRATELAKSLGWALVSTTNRQANELVALDDEDYLWNWQVDDLLERTSHRSGMLLNLEELSTFVHFPSASVKSERLVRAAEPTTKSPPPIAHDNGLVIGANTHEGRTKEVALSADQRMRHMYIIGASGTGKSTFIINAVMQDIEAGRGVAVLDPHGDLIDDVLSRIPEHRIDDVVLLDPSDDEYSVGFNILSAKTELERILLASDLVETFRRLSTSWGDRMNSVLANCIMAFLESSRGGTLLEMKRFLIDDDFRATFLETVTDKEIVYFWKNEYPRFKGGAEAPILTRLDIFLRPKPVRYMVSQKDTKLDFSKVMDEGKIFLGKLSQGAIGAENSFLLGSMIVTKFQQAAMSRQAMAASARRDFYLYIDEFHNFITPSLAELLSGVRKYRMGLILAHQELRQAAKDSEVASAILANPYTRICFRVSDSDAKKLSEGLSFFEAKDLQNLGIGQAIARIERAEYDFKLDTFAAPEIDFEEGQRRITAATEASRNKYAAKKADLQSIFAYLDEIPVKPKEKTRAAKKVKEEENEGTDELARSPRRARTEDPPTRKEPQEARPSPEEPKPKVHEAKEEPAPSEKPNVDLSIPTPGRGGTEHKRIQSLIHHWGKDKGYKSTIERGVSDNTGSVDVALENGDFKIACEVSVTTTLDHELGNVRKCLDANFNHVVVILPNARAVGRMNRALTEAFTEEQCAKVTCVTTDDLFATLQTLDSNRGGGQTVHGYKVNVRYKAQSKEETEDKKSGVIRAMLDGMKNIGKKNNKPK